MARTDLLHRAVRCALGTLLLALAVAPAASAKLERLPTAGNPHKLFGVSLRRAPGASNPPSSQGLATSPASSPDPLTSHGGTVLHSNKSFAVFWLPPGESYSSPSYESLIERFFVDVSTDRGKQSNVYSVDAQYDDTTANAAYNSSYGGSLADRTHAFQSGACTPAISADAAEPCVTDTELQAEVAYARTQPGVPQGQDTIYFIYLPEHVVTCSDAGGIRSPNCSDSTGAGYCAYHSNTTSGNYLYANMLDDVSSSCRNGQPSPNDPSVDPVLSSTSHEHNETITDPYGDAWYVTAPGQPDDGYENGDKCAYTYGSQSGNANQQIGGNQYELQQEWSNTDAGCVQTYDSPSDSTQPLAGFTASPATLDKNGTVSFDAGSQSSDSGGTSLTYAWDFGDGTTGSGQTTTHQYTAAGRHLVTVTLTDTRVAGTHPGSHWTSSSTHSVFVGPAADFSLSPATAASGQQVAFTAATPVDPGGTVSSSGYAWNFGDGATGSGSTPSHPYGSAGTYVVTLTVTDNRGYQGSSTHDVFIDDRPPAFNSLTGPSSPSPTGQTIAFSASAIDPDGSVTGYAWSFGDGSAASGPAPTHAYSRAGSYTVTVTAADNNGGRSSQSETVSVSDRPPAAAFVAPLSTMTGQTVSFDAGASTDPDGTVTNYAWNFGDGATATGPTPSHAFARAGTYAVTLAITDNSGSTNTTSHTVSVSDRPPIAAFSSSTLTPVTGQTVTFDATASNDPDGTLARYAWNFGDGATATGATPSHSFSTGGSDTVTLTVTDDSGNSATTTRTLQVTFVAPNGNLHLSRRSLRAALAHGLPVTFSTNQSGRARVALLLPARVAAKLRIGGAHEARGSNRRAYVVLATVSSDAQGSGKVVVRLSRALRAKLAHVGSLTLTIELTLTNKAHQARVLRQGVTLRH